MRKTLLFVALFAFLPFATYAQQQDDAPSSAPQRSVLLNSLKLDVLSLSVYGIVDLDYNHRFTRYFSSGVNVHYLLVRPADDKDYNYYSFQPYAQLSPFRGGGLELFGRIGLFYAQRNILVWDDNSQRDVYITRDVFSFPVTGGFQFYMGDRWILSGSMSLGRYFYVNDPERNAAWPLHGELSFCLGYRF